MKFCSTALALAAVFGLGNAFPTWPSAIDELEDVMFLNTGYKSRGFSAHVTPCDYSEFKAGRQTAAEWLRMGFHDMATTNIFFAPYGGIDASMVFEFTNGENLGAGFKTTLGTYGGLYNSRLSMADMIALGVYSSVRACGGPAIPMRGGRVDATAAGPAGVPQPQNSIGTFINQFARMGFNTTEMIQMVACGHTMGGVHGDDFPTIVIPNSAPNNFVLFDNTPAFDSQIAVRYVSGPNTDPLSVGPSTSVGRNMDTVVFNADKNVTIGAMVDPTAFSNQCSTILQKMIETVDPSIVTLSDVIQPYEVKPSGLQLTLLSDGAQMTFSGDIRVRTTVRSAAQIASVQLVYKNAAGGAGGTISTTVSGTANGFDDSFTFYGFNTSIPTTSSISSFIVWVTATSGTVSTYDNNALGFPVQDSVIVQTSQSCLNGNLNVVAAVRSTVTTPVVLGVTEKIPRATATPVPSLLSSSVTMTAGATLGPYTFYSATYAISQVTGAKFGVSSGSFADAFKDVSTLGATCSASPPQAPKVLGHKAAVGAYNFQGCYTEATGGRALSDKSTVNGTAMTIEYCASFCSGYRYFGVEYHEECYCGNTLASTSTLAALSDCYHVCPGDSYEYCGAGNRLELYLLSTAASSTQISSSPSSTKRPTSLVTSTSKQSFSTSIRSSLSSSKVSSLSSSRLLSSTSKVLSSSSTRTPSSSSSVRFSTSSVKPSSSTLKSSSSSVKPSSSTIKFSSSSVKSSSSTSKSASLSIKSSSSSKALSKSSSSSIRISSSTHKSSVLSSTTSSTPSAAPTLHIVPSAGGYNYYGCYSEGTNSRALGSSSTASDTLTIESCVAYCAQTGALFAGAEYGRECYCGNSFAAGSVLELDSDCYFTCAGSSYEYCGAGNRLTVMALNSTNSATGGNAGTGSSSSIITSTTSAAPTQTAPAIKTTIGAYTYLGCQTEGSGIRALTGNSIINYNTMTLESCSSFCGAAANGGPFKYWGVEYGGECYCGNDFNGGSSAAPDSDCYFACPAAQFEYCGAGNRLSAYVLT